MTLPRPSPLNRATPWIALALTAGYLASLLLGEQVAESRQASGGPLHAMIALVTFAVATWHLLRHRAWLGRVFRPGVTIPRPQRVRRVAAVLLGAGFAFMVATGLLCSRFLGLEPPPGVVGLHHASTKLALLVVIWHLVLCRGQIAQWFRRPGVVGRMRVTAPSAVDP